MSVITDAVLFTLWDDEAVEEMNQELERRDDARRQRFMPLDHSQAGGSKFASAQAYQACFNHVHDSDIIEAFNSVNWKHRYWTVLILHSEIGGFSVHHPTAGVLFQDE